MRDQTRPRPADGEDDLAHTRHIGRERDRGQRCALYSKEREVGSRVAAHDARDDVPILCMRTDLFVGISTSALDRGRGLAVPARDVARVVESLRRHGRLRRGYLGISSLSVALPERQRSGGSERGLLVTSIAPGSPADSGQLLVGDVILAIDETSAVRPDDLSAYLSADRVGQRAALRVLRGASPVQLDVTIGERTEAR